MKLYYSTGSCSLASHIALEASGLPFTVEKIDMATKTYADGKDYTKVNPKGAVPLLDLENGEKITENIAIMTYLHDQAPGKGLIPKDPMERVRMYEFLSFAAADMHKTITPIFRGFTSGDIYEMNKKKLLSCYAYLDSVLADGREFICKSGLTFADFYIFVVTTWLTADWSRFQINKPVNLSEFKNVGKYFNRVLALEPVQKAIKTQGIPLKD